MSENAYSREQILCGLKQTVKVGLSTEAPFDADTRIHNYIMESGCDEDDLEFLNWGIEDVFGIELPPPEWETMLTQGAGSHEEWMERVAPTLTFGWLADEIAGRAKPIPFEPLTFLGRRCVPAGMFCGLTRMAGEINPQVKRFGPSTPILHRLRGRRLSRFWDRLTWMTQDQLPPLRDITRQLHHADVAVLVLAVVNPIFWFWLMTCLPRWHSPAVVATASTCAIFAVPAIFYLGGRAVVTWMADPLPNGITTFRDLAIQLSAYNNEAREGCARLDSQ